MSAPRVLVTRPREAALALAEELAAAGWAPLIWPLLEIGATGAAPDPSAYQAVLLTSANAARLCRAGPVAAFCVGDATARAARQVGFAQVVSAQGDAADLARLVGDRLSPEGGALLHPRGEEVAGDLAGELRCAGFTVHDPVIYRAAPAGPPGAEVLAALRDGALTLAAFYSPRSSRIFAQRAESLGANLSETTALAISPAAAAPLAPCGFRHLHVAQTPSGAAMRRAIGDLFPQQRGAIS